MSTFYKTELGFRTLKLRDLELNARQRRLLVLIGTEDFHTLSQSMQQRIASPELLQQLIDLGLIIQQKSQTASFQTALPSAEPIQAAHTSVQCDSRNTENSLITQDLATNASSVSSAANLAHHSEIQTSLQISSTICPHHQPQQKIVNSSSAIQQNLSNVPPAQAAPQSEAEIQQPVLIALDFEALKTFMVQHLQQYCGLMAKQLILKIQAAEKIAELKLCQMQWITQLQESRILPKMLNTALQQVNLSMRSLQSA